MAGLRARRYHALLRAPLHRFFALRMHEAGVIKSAPKKLIAQGTDWRFVNALKQELKG